MRVKYKRTQCAALLVSGLLCSIAALAEPVSDEAALQLLQRLNQMEGEISNLRGENEQLRNDLTNLKDKQQEGFQQVGERMDKFNDTTASTPTGNPAPSSDTDEKVTKDDPNSFYSYGTGKSDDKNISENGEAKEGEKLTGTTTGTADTASVDKAGTSESAKPREERAVYDEAFNTLLKNPKDSIPLFRGFLKDYPDSPLAGSAQYWIGEALYADHDYNGAADEFLLVLKQHKSSDKAPGAALKLGYSFYELKDWEKARKTLEDVISFFPDSSDTAQKARERLDRMKSEGH